MDPDRPTLRTYLLHGSLFLATFFTCTFAGVQWLNKDSLELANFPAGFGYSLLLILFLASHEFGHYIAARMYGISVTLPFFIPIPHFLNPFGTMGAVIRIRSPFPSRRSLFDVGIAGPIAGFIVTLIVLLIGFINLPGKEYLYSIHPEYARMAEIPSGGFTFGSSLLFWFLCKIFASHGFVPPMNEIYHYPLLCVGWFGMFVTAMNLLPVGQLDGGHVVYALLGPDAQHKVARVTFVLLVLLGLTGIIPAFGSSRQLGTLGWLVWAGILLFVIRLDHPQLMFPDELSPSRRFLGWLSIAIFILSFPPIPFYD